MVCFVHFLFSGFERNDEVQEQQEEYLPEMLLGVFLLFFVTETDVYLMAQAEGLFGYA